MFAANGDFSYDMLTTDDFNGQDILVDEEQDVEEIVEKNILLDELNTCLSLLPVEEREFIQMIFLKNLRKEKLRGNRAFHRLQYIKRNKGYLIS